PLSRPERSMIGIWKSHIIQSSAPTRTFDRPEAPTVVAPPPDVTHHRRPPLFARRPMRIGASGPRSSRSLPQHSPPLFNRSAGRRKAPRHGVHDSSRSINRRSLWTIWRGNSIAAARHVADHPRLRTMVPSLSQAASGKRMWTRVVLPSTRQDAPKAQALGNFPQPPPAQRTDFVMDAQWVESWYNGARDGQAQRAHVGGGEVHQQDPVVDGLNSFAEDPQVRGRIARGQVVQLAKVDPLLRGP